MAMTSLKIIYYYYNKIIFKTFKYIILSFRQWCLINATNTPVFAVSNANFISPRTWLYTASNS